MPYPIISEGRSASRFQHMAMRLRFLGTGGSFGIPIVGCDCAACASTDPRDSRLRASVSLQWDDWKVLIDAGPDLRQQALRAGLRAIDEVWLTHGHADHTNGIDDLRVFCHRGGVPHLLPIRGESRTLKEAAARFSYAFREEMDPSGVSHPLLQRREVEGPFESGGRQVVPLPVFHGSLPCLGYRIGPLAYLTDVSRIPESTWPLLDGTRILILSALREEEHPTHLSFDQAIEVARRVGADRTWFTHFAHRMPHAELQGRFPSTMAPAYDGLEIEIP